MSVNYEHCLYQLKNPAAFTRDFAQRCSPKENELEIYGEQTKFRLPEREVSIADFDVISSNWHRVIRGKMYADMTDGSEKSMSHQTRPFRIEGVSMMGKEMALAFRAESIYAEPRPDGFQPRTREPSQISEPGPELKYWPVTPTWSQEVLWRAPSPAMDISQLFPPAPPPTEASVEELRELLGESPQHMEVLEEYKEHEEIYGEEWRWVEGRWSWHEIGGEHDEELMGEDGGNVRKIWIPGYWAPAVVPDEAQPPFEDVSPLRKPDRADEILNMEFRAPSPEAGDATIVPSTNWKCSRTSEDFMIVPLAPSRAAEETRASLRAKMAAVEELVFPTYVKTESDMLTVAKDDECPATEVTSSDMKPDSSKDVLEKETECPPMIDPVPEEFRYLLVNFVVDFLKEKPKHVENWGLNYFLAKKEQSEDDIVEMYLSERRKPIFSPSPSAVGEVDFRNIPVFRKSEEDKMNIVMSLKEIFIFFSLDVDSLAIVVDAIFERKVCYNDVIVKQGDYGDFFYVIKEGEFDVFEMKDGITRKVEHYANKGWFGELALMYDEPRRATVVAVSDGSLWCLARDTFKSIVMQKASQKRQEYSSFISAIPIFESLSEEEINSLIDCLIPKNFNEGDVIVQEGDTSDGMYIIERGTVRTSVRGRDGKEILLHRIRRGGYFGELGLLNNQPRAATMRALDQVKLLFIEKASFERLMGPCLEVMERNMEQYRKEMDIVTARASAFTENF